jgi:pimeloyl-ACP methyl ester carboxylesterase
MTRVEEHEGVLVTEAGRHIGWMTRGVPGGRMVAFLHGQPGSRRDVRAFDDVLLEPRDLMLFSIDRGGYGDTDPAGLDRREVSRDVLSVADHLGATRFPVLAVSMGGVYALTLAALAPERVDRVVLASGHVLPYDDAKMEAALSPAEQADLVLLRAGPSPELDAAYAQAAADASDVDGAVTLLGRLAESMSPLEGGVLRRPFARAVAESVAFGLSKGHQGLLEDGLRTIRPLEVDLADVRCPVRALHGTADDLEPYANLERLVPRLADVAVVAFPGLGHFAPWVWPALSFELLGDG